MTSDDAVLADWLDLAEEVARRHRQGQVLGTDPALVLRGLPPVWRPAARTGGPGDDVVALAGVALDRLGAEDAELRPVLVEAAAGCLGSDLPALLRRVRPAVDPPGSPSAGTGRGEVGVNGDGSTPDDQTGEPPRRRTRPRPGGRLAVAGGVGAVALAVIGGLGSLTTGSSSTVTAGTDRQEASDGIDPADRADRTGPTALTARPTPLNGGVPGSVAWQPPHLVVDVDGTRYRYRLEGHIDGIALAAGASAPTVVVTAGDDRWELAVPALDATGPGRPGS